MVFHLFTICDIDTHKIAALVTVKCCFDLIQRKELKIRGNCMICSFIFLLLLNRY